MVVVKDTLNDKVHYLNPVADYLDQLTTNLDDAPKLSSEELAEEAYRVLKDRIPIGCSTAVYTLEGEDFKLHKIL